MLNRKEIIFLSCFILSSCVPFSGVTIPEQNLPIPLQKRSVEGLESGKFELSTLNTSEAVLNPTWLAIDSQDNLFVTSGNGNDSTLYKVQIGTGVVTKFKSGALNLSYKKEFDYEGSPLPQAISPPRDYTAAITKINVENAIFFQQSPTLALDGSDNVYIMLPYTKGLFGPEKFSWQLQKINFTPVSNFFEPGYEVIHSSKDHGIKGALSSPKDFTVDSEGFFIAGFSQGGILKFNSKENTTVKVRSPHGNDLQDYYNFGVTGIEVDGKENYWITQSTLPLEEFFDWLGPHIDFVEKIKPNDRVQKVFASESEQHFKQPSEIVFDKHNNIYISDSGNNRVIKMSEDGSNFEVLIGNEGNSEKAGNTLKNPIGMAWDSRGNLYIADHNNNSIKVLKPS